jgi:hypothetical protein
MMLDLGKLAHSAGTDSAQLANQLKTMNPSTQIKALLGKGALKVVGEETIDGVKTVHYLSDMTAEQYVEAYGDPSKTADLKKGLKLAGDQKIKTELWVDEAYQVRKAHVASGTIMDMTMTYTDYGKPVNVVAPPASDVVDMAQMLNGLKPPA